MLNNPRMDRKRLLKNNSRLKEIDQALSKSLNDLGRQIAVASRSLNLPPPQFAARDPLAALPWRGPVHPL